MILWFFCWNLRIIHHLTHPPKILFISIYKQTYTYTSRIFTWLWITDLFIFVDTWLKGICSFLEMGFWIKGEYHKKVGFFFLLFGNLGTLKWQKMKGKWRDGFIWFVSTVLGYFIHVKGTLFLKTTASRALNQSLLPKQRYFFFSEIWNYHDLSTYIQYLRNIVCICVCMYVLCICMCWYKLNIFG